MNNPENNQNINKEAEGNKDVPVNPADVAARIVALMQEFTASGAVDSEVSELRGILDQLTKGQVTAEDADERVSAIEVKRQDYH
jgi:dihydroxyacetone kinase-like predicted kinase